MNESEFRKKLLTILLQTGDLTQSQLNEAINKISFVLTRYRQINSLDIWWGNNALKKEILSILKDMSSNITNATERQITAIWEATEEKNDKIVLDALMAAGVAVSAGKLYKYFNRVLPSEIDPQTTIKIDASIIKMLGKSPRNVEALEVFRKRKIKGLELSERVWRIQEKQVLPLIESQLAVGIEEGSSAATISRDLRQYLNNPESLFRRVRNKKGSLVLSQAAKNYNPGQGVYRSAYKNAIRLSREEVNQAFRLADHERWQKLDFIKGIEVGLSAQHPVYDICDQAAGIYPKDFQFPGWHPQCLCHATPVLMKREDFRKHLKGEKVELDPVKELPQGFQDWLKGNEERIKSWKGKPYFIKYNTKIVEQIINF
ncbi:hypothetical protein ACUNWD_09975 [Sunxiuqinia sp. A32]|uniref:hypothetical protein n=1 Tax=Sunxiuqinia sp. A32 TaxID=3461496 RepID=UPI0040453628